MEFWYMTLPWPVASKRESVTVEAQIERLEGAGWDGTYIPDSQSLAADPYACLALAARASTHLGLGTGVTNPYTRHPSVTACGIATVQALSGGRAVLGIGRGDSALAYLGLAPASVADFVRYVDRVQDLLSGRGMALESEAVESLHLKDRPEAARLTWLPEGLPKVPVEIFATGPRVIAAAATHADRIMLAVGGDLGRITWGLDLAREAAGDRTLSTGAMVVCVAHSDRDVARRLAIGRLSSNSRFSVMHGQAVGPVSDSQRAVLENLHKAYDMNQHSQPDASQGSVFTEDYIDSMAIVGPPDECIERLREIEALGLDRVYISGPSAKFTDPEAETARRVFEHEVLPAFRGVTAAS